MRAYLASRMLSAAIVVVGVVSLVFLLIHIVPGDPIEVMLGEGAAPADRAALTAALGLDRPLPEQWLGYFGRLATLDLGTSLHSQQAVSEILAERLPSTVALAVGALGVALVIALPCGTLAALRRGTPLDYGVLAGAMLGVSIPTFWLGPLLMLVFALWLGWLPVSGQEGIPSLILPALTLGVGIAAFLARMIRAALLEVLHEDYVRTARALGLPEHVVIRHVFANAGLPLLTVLGLQLGALLSGAVITETVFSWPGIGSLTVEAIQQRDYPVVQGCVLVISLTYVTLNIFTDIVCAWLDPRVRLA